MTRENRIIEATIDAVDAAIEISECDPEIRTCDFEAFCLVIWPDDDNMKKFQLSREDYRQALQDAWKTVHL